MNKTFRMLLLGVLSLAGFTQADDFTLPTPEVIGSSWVYTTEGIYHNVRDDLITAIEDEGRVIS